MDSSSSRIRRTLPPLIVAGLLLSVVYFSSTIYVPGAGRLRLIDLVDVGNEKSEKDHDYAIENVAAGWWRVRNEYPGGRYVIDDGRSNRGSESFTVQAIKGKDLYLIKRSDTWCKNQRMNVSVDGDAAGILSVNTSVGDVHQLEDTPLRIPAAQVYYNNVRIRLDYVSGEPDINTYRFWVAVKDNNPLWPVEPAAAYGSKTLLNIRLDRAGAFLQIIVYALYALALGLVCLHAKQKFAYFKAGNITAKNTLAFLVICVVAYSLVAGDRNFQQSGAPNHVYFAEAYSKGKLGIDIPLEETPQGWQDRFYNHHGPMPAILMTPIAAIYGREFSDNTFTIYLTGIMGAIFMLALFCIGDYGRKLPLRDVWLYSVLFSFGTLILVYSGNGALWFQSQITSTFFITMFMLVFLTNRNPVLVGAFIGASMLARYHTVLFIFIYWAYLALDKGSPASSRLRRFLVSAAVLSFFILIVMAHNFVRFGSVYNFGYPAAFVGTRYFGESTFDYNNIGPHLGILFFSLPVFVNEYPYVKVSANGLSVLLTTPLFFYLFRLKYETALKKSLLAGTLAYILYVMGYIGTGFVQFGYRLIMEATPMLVILMALNNDSIKKDRLFYLLLVVGILVNIFGALTLRRPNIHELFYI